MAAATSTTISYLGTMAAGAMVDGTGFAPATQGIAATTVAAGGGYLADMATAYQLAADRGVTFNNVGARDIQGHGAFTNCVPELYNSLVGNNAGLDRLTAHGDLMFGGNPLKMAQTMGIAETLVFTSAQLAPSLEKLDADVKFGRMPGLDEMVYPADGVFPNHLGKGYPNLQSVVTNGASTLVTESTAENFALLATDLINIGNAFTLENIALFGNPGQIISSARSLNALQATGLADALAAINIDPDQIYNLALDSYNDIMQAVLDSITIPELVSNAQSLLGSNIADMQSLGDYTDFDKLFTQSKDVITFATFEEFRDKLQSIELGRIGTLAELGAYLDAVVPVTLPTIENATNFVRRDYVDTMTAQFLGGTGTNGRITIADMVGTLGGVGVSTPAAAYKTAMDALETSGDLSDLSTHITEFKNALNGDYTGSPNYTITDPSGISGFSLVESEAYQAYVNAKIGQIETDLSVLVAKANVNENINKAINNWLAIYKKVNDEKTFQSRIDMNYDIRTTFPDNAYSFITNLKGSINQEGKKAIIVGMVDQAVTNGDIGGEYMRAYITELENRKVGDAYDIRWRAEFRSS